MNEPPRNVTPPEDREDLRESAAATGRPAEERQDWTGWSWQGRAATGRNFPWLGILLFFVGVALLIQAALPTYLTAGTVLLFAIGLSLIAAWLFGGSWFAAIPGLLLVGLAVAGLIRELNIYTGPGTTALSLAAAFVLIWLIGLVRKRRSNWPLWAGAILGLIGGVQVFGQLSNIPELGVVWPFVIIVIGVLLMIAARRGS